jgi:ribosomal protein L29
MAKLKIKEIKNMSKGDREKKVKELKMELMKANTAAEKQGGSKAKEIRRMIARILTIKDKEDVLKDINKK